MAGPTIPNSPGGPPSNPTNLGYIKAGVQTLSSIFGYIGAKKQQERQFAQDDRSTKEKYAQDLAQWHRANAYNDPSQVMARLKAAGLNPNLVYGSGSATQTAAPSPTKEAPKANYFQPPLDLAQGIETYQNARLQEAQIDKTIADTNYTIANTTGKGVSTETATFDLSMKKRFTAKEKSQGIEKTAVQIAGIKATTLNTREKTRYEKYKADLGIKYNLSPQGDTYLKQIVIAADRAGENLGDLSVEAIKLIIKKLGSPTKSLSDFQGFKAPTMLEAMDFLLKIGKPIRDSLYN